MSDPSGAVIQGALVTLVDSNKGYDFKETTDDSGRYLFRQVPPGTYAVSVEAKNFQPQRKEGVSLSINQNASVDFSLKVGAAAQTVDVTAVGLELQTQDAVTGQVVDRNLINNLPLINRRVFDLAFLAPGVTIADEQCVGCTATNFISNGSRNSTADVVIDGVTTSNFEQNSGIMSATYTPSVEAVEEFKVQQSNFSAEFGFTGSSIVNVVTRSGEIPTTEASTNSCGTISLTRTIGLPTTLAMPVHRSVRITLVPRLVDPFEKIRHFSSWTTMARAPEVSRPLVQAYRARPKESAISANCAHCEEPASTPAGSARIRLVSSGTHLKAHILTRMKAVRSGPYSSRTTIWRQAN